MHLFKFRPTYPGAPQAAYSPGNQEGQHTAANQHCQWQLYKLLVEPVHKQWQGQGHHLNKHMLKVYRNNGIVCRWAAAPVIEQCGGALCMFCGGACEQARPIPTLLCTCAPTPFPPPKKQWLRAPGSCDVHAPSAHVPGSLCARGGCKRSFQCSPGWHGIQQRSFDAFKQPPSHHQPNKRHSQLPAQAFEQLPAALNGGDALEACSHWEGNARTWQLRADGSGTGCCQTPAQLLRAPPHLEPANLDSHCPHVLLSGSTPRLSSPSSAATGPAACRSRMKGSVSGSVTTARLAN